MDGEFSADLLDTALALMALAAAETSAEDAISKALTFLLAQQNTDGGWSCVASGASNVPCTATVLTALAAYRQQFLLESALTDARRFLLALVDINGGISDATADPIYTTALAVYAILKAGDDLGDDNLAILSFLQNSQNTDGSWGEPRYSPLWFYAHRTPFSAYRRVGTEWRINLRNSVMARTFAG